MSENRIEWLTAQIAAARDMADGLPADWFQERAEMRMRADALTKELEAERAAQSGKPRVIQFTIASLAPPPLRGDREPEDAPPVEPVTPVDDAPEMGDAELMARLLASSAACGAAAVGMRASAAVTRAAAGIGSGTDAEMIGRCLADVVDDYARRLSEISLESFARALLIAVTTPEQRAAMAAADEEDGQ